MKWKEFINQDFDIIGGITIHLDKVLFAGLILFGTWAILKVLRRAITRPTFIIDKIGKKRRITIFLITKYLGWFVSVFVSLHIMGINLTALMLGSTAVLVGLGLGLQNIFKDLVSGLFLLFEGSIKIGDVIEADGVVGKVMEINLRSSVVMTRDDVIIIIPNSKFIAETVVNWSHDSEKVRFTIDVNLAYGSDVEKVISCLNETMLLNKMISASPKPFVRLANFGESALEFEMMFWSKNTFRIETIKSDVRRNVYQKLRENGLAIPFPQRDIHIKGIDRMIEIKRSGNND
jgi:small-conductance mechanosensitive channel